MGLNDRREAKGEPAAYYLWPASATVYQIGFIPVPNVVVATRVYYYLKGTTLSADGDSPIIPARYHYLLEKFAVAMAFQKQQDPAFQVYLQQYEAGIYSMKVDILNQKRGASRFQTIRIADNDRIY